MTGPCDIANALICAAILILLICAAILILLKQKQIKIIVHGIFPRNKGNSFSRQKLLQANMLKGKCSQVPNVAYLQPESDWVKTSAELEMAYFYKDELHLIEEGYQKLASSNS